MDPIRFLDARDEAAVDIVIVGAGVSGLYCAQRLIEQDPARRITIVERLNRVGGRLDTDLIDIAPGDVVREEEGGMRFNYDMTELMQLTNALGLCGGIVPFPMGSNVTGFGNTNRFWLRGRRFTAVEAAEGGNAIWGEIYGLNADEQGLSPAEIVMKAFHAVLHQNQRTPPASTGPQFWADFREHVCWNDFPINQWQMWGLLRDMGRSQECIQMLSETIGFAGPFKAPINAGDAFQILADFPSNPTYFTFSGGLATLPKALAADLPSQVTVLLSTNVDAIAGTAGDFTLTLTEAPGDLNSNPYLPGGKNKILTASTLVLAVATNGMERLFITSSALNAQPDAERLWDSIHAAQGMPLMKINLYFEHPWWEDGAITPPVQFGPNFTDLPVNAVYPFYSSVPGTGDEIPDGATQFKCAPPIRDAGTREALWRALLDGEIDLVASDHSPCPPAMKDQEHGDFFQAWGGIASLQLGLPAVWHEARSRGATIEQLSQWMSAAPARLARLESSKGRLAPGFDADIVIWNPDAPVVVDETTLHHRHPLTPYRGRTLTGLVKASYVSGVESFRAGRFAADTSGRLLTSYKR